MKLWPLISVALTTTIPMFVLGCQAHGQGSIHTESGGVKASANISVEAKVGPKAEAKGGIQIVFDKETSQLKAPDGVILFDLDRASLKNDEKTAQTLVQYRNFLSDHPKIAIRIEGHTDSRSTDDYNLDLSRRRAASVNDWLVKNGIDEERLDSVGKGESTPCIARDACGEANMVDPAKYAQCKDGGPAYCEEEVWKKNRRVEFHVTEGAATLVEKKPEPKPKPEPPPPAPPPPPEECPWLWGVHLSGLGPNSLVRLGAATQPLCWLELILDLGYNTGWAETADAIAEIHTLPILARGRFWIMESHSLLVDAGLGVTPVIIRGQAGEYTRNGALFGASAGIGYGYRAIGPLRIAVLGGVAFQLGDLPQGDYGSKRNQRTDLDNESDNRIGPALPWFGYITPYGEVSLGLMF